MTGWALPDAARRLAVDRPDDPAVVDGRVWTWAELDGLADRIASALARLVEGAPLVGFLADAGALSIALLHGAGRAGVTLVPLNHRLAQPELEAIAAHGRCSLVVAGGRHLARARSIWPSSIDLADLARAHPERWLATLASDPTRPAVAVATSGTTGRPKLALLTHAQLSASAVAWNAVLPPATGWLASLSLAHVAGLGIVWRAAAAGVPVVVAAGSTRPASDQAASDRSASDRLALIDGLGAPLASHASVVAVQLARLLDATEDAPPPSGLRALLVGGGPVPSSLVARALAAGWPIVPTYGLTETASGIAALSTADAHRKPGSAGRAVPGTDVRIAEPGADGIGEIQVRGPSVFAGYVGLEAETAEAFTPDGWLRTGDLGSLDDAFLTVSDRRVDLIVSGGENVYPAEVEAVLTAHPAVLEAGVAGRPDATWGSVPVAALVMRPGIDASDEALRDHCRTRVAAFKVPAAFVRVEALPRNTSGKLRRDVLRRLLLSDDVGARVGGELGSAVTRSGSGSSCRS